ncbi:MAG: oxidoreductase [Dehalococcoidia bacterium]|nr:oxidoreductase [Dehalococcoidia bacterium]
MDQKIALVTGGSSGIGKAITEQLAANGFYVFAAARRLDRLELLRSETIEPLCLDVTDPAATQTAIKHIQSTKGRLDVLVNNAGYGLYGTLEGLTLDQAHHQFDVNVFGLAQVTKAVLPLMRQQQAGTIVNIASVVGRVALPVAGWYCASKHAVEALSDAMRGELKPFGIKVIVIEPGAIKTEFDDVALGTLDSSADLEAYQPMVNGFRKVIQTTYGKAPGPEVIARTVLKAVTSKNPRPRYAIPFDAKSSILFKKIFGDRIMDRMIRQQLKK